MILRLARVSAGTISFEGTNVSELDRGALKRYYGHVQGVFQDPVQLVQPDL